MLLGFANEARIKEFLFQLWKKKALEFLYTDGTQTIGVLLK